MPDEKSPWVVEAHEGEHLFAIFGPFKDRWAARKWAVEREAATEKMTYREYVLFRPEEDTSDGK